MTVQHSNTIKVWKWRNEQSLWSHEFDRELLAAATSSDGSHVLAVALEDEGAKLISYDFGGGVDSRPTRGWC